MADAPTTTVPEHPRREASRERAAAGLPGRKDPRWLHSDPAWFTADAVCVPVPGDVTAADVTALAVEGLPHRAVFVDGHYRADLSDAPDGVRLAPLGADDEVTRVHYGHHDEADGLSALNGAHWEDGLLVDVQRGVQASLHLIHLHTDAPGVRYDRVLVHAQPGSELTLFQEETGGSAATVVNAVTEVHAHPTAIVRRDHLQDLHREASAAHTFESRVQKDASVSDVNLHLGAGRGRTTATARLLEPGADAELSGLYFMDESRRSDHWTRVDHAAPHATSRSLYKGLLAGKSRGAFTGNVLVRDGATGTSAEQENRNLLLSRDALAESTPQMEIHHDDVACAHGSTVGQLDEDALFFLRARGIGPDRARALLTEAFAAEALERLAVPAVRDAVAARIQAWFKEDEA
ncbi:MAG: Fe-S cluster assembly protein SufD [Thermoplasmatota archaeon]